METNWKFVQARLAELGFDPGPVDGIRGPKTDAAIVAFKKSVGLVARSYYGPVTDAALFAEAPMDAGAAPWMAPARKLLGLHETRDRSRLMSIMPREALVDPDDIPWCGAFVASVMRLWKPGIGLPVAPLAARGWLSWGNSVAPRDGAIAVFWRGSRDGWQGHIGFIVGADDTALHILGGNQSDAVTIARMDMGRVLSIRWPALQPIAGGLTKLSTAGKPLSTNEA